jgi:pyridoxamine 5'-phosphate oxidase
MTGQNRGANSELLEENVSRDPIEQFSLWYDEALSARLPQPDAMALATTSADGAPSVRMVLLKEYDPGGFVFYTNTRSRKANDLLGNPRAAVVLFWPELHRQIRIEGSIEVVSDEQSDAYFAVRPRGSQISAAASHQSAVLSGRAELEQQVRELEAELGDGPIPRPDFWGGYRLRPDVFEFWQGRPDRLHDRLRYRRAGDDWVIDRLSP